MTEYERGQWEAFNRVLHLINTYETKLVKKGDLYEDIMELRPTQSQTLPPTPEQQYRVEAEYDRW